MSNIQIFNNPDFGTVRTLEEESGAIMFCGKDVAMALGYKSPKDAISAHCKGAVKHRLPTSSGEQDMTFIPESDLYRLVFSSKLPTAEKFTDWVTSEVLPSIRKNGGYIAGQEQLTPEELMAKALLVANKTLADREARICELTAQNSQLTVEKQIMQPKAEYFDELVDRNLLTNFRETAKELGIKPKAFVAWQAAAPRGQKQRPVRGQGSQERQDPVERRANAYHSQRPRDIPAAVPVTE